MVIALVTTLFGKNVEVSAAEIKWDTTESSTSLVTIANTTIYNGCYEVKSVLKKLGTIPAGQLVKILGYSKTATENWYKLEYNGIVGYAPEEYFTAKKDWTSIYKLMNQLGGGSMDIFSDEVVISFLAGTLAPSGLTPMEKAQNVHDYLCMTVSFDKSYSAYTAHDALFTGKGVCQAYANAFEAIMDAAGVETDFIGGVGAGENGIELHAWNRCLVDGKYYYVDSTWDDEGKYAGTKFFWSTDETFGGTHVMTEINPYRAK